MGHAALNSGHMTQLYDSYVRSRTLVNWKFWIVSFVTYLLSYAHTLYHTHTHRHIFALLTSHLLLLLFFTLGSKDSEG